MSHSHPRPGHVVVPALAIGSLALVLAGGLGLLGFMTRLDRGVQGIVIDGGVSGFSKTVPLWGQWLATALVAYGLAVVILEVPCFWRRVVLWLTTVVLIVCWAPVLGLAARQPTISAPLIAAMWSGVCSLVYAYNHRMPVDAEPEKVSDGES